MEKGRSDVRKTHLTKRFIDAAIYQGDGTTRCVYWDDETRGFGLRVYPSLGYSGS